MNTSVKTIKVLSSVNGKSVWKFCTTSDGSYIARKNGWQDVKVFKSWDQMIFQYNTWLNYETRGAKTFVPGYPKKAPTVQTELPMEDAVNQVAASAI